MKTRLSIKRSYSIVLLLLLFAIFTVYTIFHYADTKELVLENSEIVTLQSQNTIIDSMEYTTKSYEIVSLMYEDDMKKSLADFKIEYEAKNNTNNAIIAALKAKYSNLFDFYVIEDGVIVNSTLESALGVDFKDIPDFHEVLEGIRLGDDTYISKISSDLSTGEIRKWGYIPADDHKVLLEIGINPNEIKRFIEENNYNEIASEIEETNEYIDKVRMYEYINVLNNFSHPEEIISEAEAQIVNMVVDSKEDYQIYDENGMVKKRYIYVKSDSNGVEVNTRIIAIEFNNDVIIDRLNDIKISSIQSFIICIIICFTVSFIFINKLIVNPIVNLVKIMEKISWEMKLDIKIDEKENNEVNILIVTFNDLMYKLKEAMASQSRFITNMSHEIRTPLNAILGYTEIIKSVNKDEKQEYYLSAIDTSGNVLLDIVTDILDFAALNAGKYTASYIPCNIGDFLEEIKILFWNKIDIKDLDFELIYDTEIPTLMLPMSIIRQIIINFVGNAIKFTDDGGIIIKIMCVNNKGNYDIDISVIDTGIGIEEDMKEFIFIEFEQADESHVKKGTGLGLAISQKFAEIIGANITLESEFGEGSSFTLKMKNIEVSNIKLESVYNNNEEIDFEFTSQKVMIVDDIKDNREVLKIHCENLNLKAKTYYSAIDALKNIEIYKPDIILTDLRMPEMSGEELARRVKEKNPSMPIICVTASINPYERYDLKHFDDVVNKPVASSVLAKFIAKYIESKDLGENRDLNIDKSYSSIELSDDEFYTLKEKHLEEIKILKAVLKPKKVKELSKKIIDYGETVKNDSIINIGNNLYTSSNNLDIDSIMKILGDLIDYLEEK